MDWKRIFQKSKIYPIILIAICFIVYQCRKKEAVQLLENFPTLRGTTMGVKYAITIEDPMVKVRAGQIDSLLHAFNLTFSTYIENSEISLFSASDSIFTASTELLKVMKRAQEVYKNTNHAFDPTVMPLVNAWGFGYQKIEKLPTHTDLDSILQFVGFDNIEIKGNQLIKKNAHTQLDLSAIAKGYGCDVVAQFLEQKGITNYVVEIGGEITCKGEGRYGKGWEIGIEEPVENQTQERNNVRHILYINKVRGIATSGNYRNFYEKEGKKYTHTIDPKTGKQIQSDLLSATVLAPSCMIADAYATAFMVMGSKKAIEIAETNPTLEVLFIYNLNNQLETYLSETLRTKLEK